MYNFPGNKSSLQIQMGLNSSTKNETLTTYRTAFTVPRGQTNEKCDEKENRKVFHLGLY
jgi:hypothetical protein